MPFMGWDNSVGIGTRYGLDGPRIEFQWVRDFTHPPLSALGPTQPPTQRISFFVPGGKAAGTWRR